MNKFWKVTIILILVFLLYGVTVHVFADTATPSPTPSVSPTPTDASSSDSSDSSTVQQLQTQIAQYQSKISDLQGQENTLSSAIKVIDNQVKVAELQVENTQEQIKSLGKDIDVTKSKMAGLETNITGATATLVKHISETYQLGRQPAWQILLSSGNINNFLTQLKYSQMVQVYDKQQIYAAEQTKQNYSEEKAILQAKQDEATALQTKLTAYTTQINQEKDSKQSLLTETQGSEENYQKMLSQAQAELNGFSRFVQNSGGDGLLSGQTSCDSWGCYYNQRDSGWGGILINGQSGYSIAGYGCLITSTSMVASHMGHHVMPADIATSGEDSFAVGTAMLKYTIHVDGLTISRNSVGKGGMDGALQNGPVIVGIYAYGGTHYVVLKSGSNGSYVMDDPYLANGHDINFTDHYSMGSIFEVDTLSI